MREILFRGKTKDTKWWIEGYYAIESNHACFQSELKHTHFIFKDEFMDWGIGGLVQYEVISKTVGQYTGLTDKNGKRIYEGDIVCFHGTLYNEIFPIVFADGCFRLGTKNGYSYTLQNLCSALEVIGNIHDNPELLKGE